jgi:predicted oxidoreductase
LQIYHIPGTTLSVSRIAYGAMNLGGTWDHTPFGPAEISRAVKIVVTAHEQGITLFDHADIYTHGKSEAIFGEVLQQLPGLRQKILLQSKCGIRFPNEPQMGLPGRYDCSYQHIIQSVEGSLRRLRTDYLDIFLLHRPDPLLEPDEVAKAFDELQRRGWVRFFGVSNHNAAQIALLQKHVVQPLCINQVELSLLHAQLIEDGILANQAGGDYSAVAGTLDYCRREGILIQAWSPLARGRLITFGSEAESRVQQLVGLIHQMAREQETSPEAIALAWLLRHPAHIQPIVGTTNRDRLIASCWGDGITLDRAAWYRLFVIARGQALP